MFIKIRERLANVFYLALFMPGSDSYEISTVMKNQLTAIHPSHLYLLCWKLFNCFDGNLLPFVLMAANG